MGGFHHVVEEIVAYDGAVHLLSKQVHDEHIAWLEHVDGGLIGQRSETALLGLGCGNPFYIRALRHELNSKCAPDHWFLGMQYLKSVGVLVVEPLLFKNSPDFLRGKLPRSFQ